MTVKFIRFKIEDVTHPPFVDGHFEILTNRFWAVTNEGEILQARGASYQCNKVRELVDRLVSFEKHPATHVVFLEIVYVPHNCNDYA